MWRENIFQTIAAQHSSPLNVGSILEDLPITKARGSYSKIVDGRVIQSEGDKFCFHFFAISTEHTDRINFIMLENAHYISTIVFKSRTAASRTLREYLTMPCELNGVPTFKVIDSTPNDERLNFLRKLEKVVGDLGSKVTSTYQIGVPDPLAMAGQLEFSEFTRLYAILGLSHVVIIVNTRD